LSGNGKRQYFYFEEKELCAYITLLV